MVEKALGSILGFAITIFRDWLDVMALSRDMSEILLLKRQSTQLLRLKKLLAISPSTAFQARAVTGRLLCLQRC